MDKTGFSYDIVVTKASVELSRLDRARITVSLFLPLLPCA
jgi:hypothetical protein